MTEFEIPVGVSGHKVARQHDHWTLAWDEENVIGPACRLRWRIELLFTEWKSYANLHAFGTRNRTTAEGLIWTAIAAAATKCYLAHVTQVLHGVEVFTRKSTMCAHQVLTDIFRVLATGYTRQLNFVLRAAIVPSCERSSVASKTRPKKAKRLQLGLKPVLGAAQVPTAVVARAGIMPL